MSKYGVEKNLQSIIALVTTPYWTAERKNRILELAEDSLSQIQYYKKLNQTIAELDDEVGGDGPTDD